MFLNVPIGYSGQSFSLNFSGRVVVIKGHSSPDGNDIKAGFEFLKQQLMKAPQASYIIVLKLSELEEDLAALFKKLSSYLSFLNGIGVKSILASCNKVSPDYLSFLKDCESDNIKTHFFFDEAGLQNWMTEDVRSDYLEADGAAA